jgi:hypothetical protein
LSWIKAVLVTETMTPAATVSLVLAGAASQLGPCRGGQPPTVLDDQLILGGKAACVWDVGGLGESDDRAAGDGQCRSALDGHIGIQIQRTCGQTGLIEIQPSGSFFPQLRKPCYSFSTSGR